MKRIIFSFLVIFVMSCGSRSELKGTRINILFRDSVLIPHQYALLFVRDSGIVVAPGFYDAPGSPLFIPNGNIFRVYHAGDGKSKGMFFGGLIGGAAGMGTTIAIGVSQGGNTGGGEGVGFTAAIVAVPSIALGMIIGYNLAHDEDEYDLERSHDRYELGGYAKYPDHEPPELQKIK